jgi:hypothetical protein
MKVLAVSLAILAILISVVPQFTDCQSQGRALSLANGQQVPMKCHWTAGAEVGVGITTFALGAALFFSRRRETRIVLGILGMFLGVFAILLPTALIGVCMSPEMLCNSLMKPALILTGTLVISISLAVLIISAMQAEQTFAPA